MREVFHVKTWKKYTDALEKEGVDEKIINALDQMRTLHRNPISHPDENLSIDEAMVLVGLAQSAIVAMAADSKQRKLEGMVESSVG